MPKNHHPGLLLAILLVLNSGQLIAQTGVADEASLVRRFLLAEEQATGEETDLSPALAALESPSHRVQLAALRMILATSHENAAAVEPLR